MTYASKPSIGERFIQGVDLLEISGRKASDNLWWFTYIMEEFYSGIVDCKTRKWTKIFDQQQIALKRIELDDIKFYCGFAFNWIH